MSIHAFARKSRSFLALPLLTQLWLLPAWLLLGISRAMILLLSFRRLVPWLGKLHQEGALVPLLDARQEARARTLQHVVQLAASYTPWISNCFPQAVTARLLLGLHGIPFALYFGVARDVDTAEMLAHAWVTAGKVPVSGGTSFGHYTVVACFAGGWSGTP
jgi:hypothetical protein